MVIDTSALITILLNEPGADLFAGAMVSNTRRLLSAVSALEAAVVIEAKKGSAGVSALDELLTVVQVEIVSLDETQYYLARNAYTQFGKGRHPAGLNFGDCCAYALAKFSNEPLLFKGQDFSKTDIDIVPA